MEMKKILITGGAGFIGSHTCALLAAQGYSIMSADHKAQPGASHPSRTGDIADASFLESIFSEFHPDAVIHLAAYSNPLESLERPEHCYRNNVTATTLLLDTMRRHRVASLIFASSASVYADSHLQTPYPETTPCRPLTPYADSKWMCEHLIGDYGNAHNLRYVIMRHFNPAGADTSIGQQHRTHNHAIAALTKTALGILPSFAFHGTDYPTPDGSSLRDYVYVGDVASAHLQALRYLEKGNAPLIANIGTGTPTSLKELLAAIERHCGHAIPVEYKPRRDIYQPYLVADISRARQMLGWEPAYPSLQHIIETTFRGFA